MCQESLQEEKHPYNPGCVGLGMEGPGRALCNGSVASLFITHALSCKQVPLTRQQLSNLYIVMYMREVVNTIGGCRAAEGRCDPTGQLALGRDSVWAGSLG